MRMRGYERYERKNEGAGVRAAIRRALVCFAVSVVLLAAFLAALDRLGAFERSREKDYRVLDATELDLVADTIEYDSEEEEKLVSAALSLVGRLGYFWGGKYNAVGENPEWGEMREVTSSGHSTSGKTIPFGMDCSGYVTWCFIQQSGEVKKTAERVGEGTWNQWMKSEPIKKADARIGDLAFQNEYPGAKGNHIGIVVAFLENGEPLIAHCSPSANGVVVSTTGASFRYFRRPCERETEHGEGFSLLP